MRSGAVRDAAKYPGFEHIGELLARERSLKLRRRNRKLVEVIGEEFFKVPELNKRAYSVSLATTMLIDSLRDSQR